MIIIQADIYYPQCNLTDWSVTSSKDTLRPGDSSLQPEDVLDSLVFMVINVKLSVLALECDLHSHIHSVWCVLAVSLHHSDYHFR